MLFVVAVTAEIAAAPASASQAPGSLATRSASGSHGAVARSRWLDTLTKFSTERQ